MHETLEEELADELVDGLLVAINLMEIDGSKVVRVRHLDGSGGRGGFTSGLVDELLVGSFVFG